MRLIIDIKVSDLKRAVLFYTGILALPCRRLEEEWAAISVGDAELHLYVAGGVTGDVEFYVNDIDKQVTELKKKGLMFISGVNKPNAVSVNENNITSFPWGRTAFFKDSEGNELAIVQDFE